MTTYDWALCHRDTGEVQFIMSVNNNDDYERGGFHNGMRVFLVPSDADHVQIKERTYYDYDADGFLARAASPGEFYKWTAAKEWEVDSALLLAELKQLRTNRLFRSDWTQLADAPLTDAKKAEWVTYRAALRDLPDNLPEEFDGLSGFQWPTQPS